MKFLLDECCPLVLAQRLRDTSHDAVHMLEIGAGTDDDAVLLQGSRESRLLVTEDKGFGDLVMRLGRPTAGIVLIRMDASLAEEKWRRLQALLSAHGGDLLGAYSVVEEHRFRVRRLDRHRT